MQRVKFERQIVFVELIAMSSERHSMNVIHCCHLQLVLQVLCKLALIITHMRQALLFQNPLVLSWHMYTAVCPATIFPIKASLHAACASCCARAYLSGRYKSDMTVCCDQPDCASISSSSRLHLPSCRRKHELLRLLLTHMLRLQDSQSNVLWQYVSISFFASLLWLTTLCTSSRQSQREAFEGPAKTAARRLLSQNEASSDSSHFMRARRRGVCIQGKDAFATIKQQAQKAGKRSELRAGSLQARFEAKQHTMDQE